MSDHAPSGTTTGAAGQHETLLANAEAERDRYQLLLDINNAVVSHLGLGCLLHRHNWSVLLMADH